jgi:AcrR family transcriptional regulator
MKRQQRYREETRAAILDEARELFVRDGYEGFSMRRLAEKVKYSTGAIYLYFKNKDELFDCLVEESFSKLSAAGQRLFHSHRERDPVLLLKKGARAYVNFGLRNPSAYKFAFILSRSSTAPARKPHSAFEALRLTVKRCVEEKRFRRVDVDTTSQALWAALHGVTSLLILRPSFPWVNRDRLIKQVIDSAVDSLVVGKTRRTP